MWMSGYMVEWIWGFGYLPCILSEGVVLKVEITINVLMRKEKNEDEVDNICLDKSGFGSCWNN